MVAADSRIRLADGDHVVQFFDESEHLVSPVSGYLTASVLGGDAVIVLAIPAHREMFRAALLAAGVDVQAAEASGALLMLDAVGMVRRLMTDGRLDVQAFEELVAQPVRQAAGDNRSVRVYGELVAVLWRDGNVAGAIDLETLWNQLGSEVPFALFCTYPSTIGSTEADAFAQVCSLHSEIRGHLPGTARAGTSQRFDGTPRALRLARLFVEETLEHWDREELVDVGALVVTELATNAVVHARSDFTVQLSRRNGYVRVGVSDSNIDSPHLQEAGTSSVSGRGLYLVDAITHRWGHDLIPGGKVVWAEIGTP